MVCGCVRCGRWCSGSVIGMEELRSGEDSDAERRSQTGAADDSEKADGESEENGEFAPWWLTRIVCTAPYFVYVA